MYNMKEKKTIWWKETKRQKKTIKEQAMSREEIQPLNHYLQEWKNEETDEKKEMACLWEMSVRRCLQAKEALT